MGYIKDHIKVSPVVQVSLYRLIHTAHSACSKIKLLEFTCHKLNMFINIHKIKLLESTGLSILNKPQFTKVHWCNGAPHLLTHFIPRVIIFNNVLRQLMLQFNTVSEWVGDTMSYIHKSNGIHIKIIQITLPIRDQLSQLMIMIEWININLIWKEEIKHRW